MSNIDRPSVGIIGLGIMGGLMAKTLIENGFKVFGRDIEPACNQRLRRAGGQVLKSNALVAVHADVLMISVASTLRFSRVSATCTSAAGGSWDNPTVRANCIANGVPADGSYDEPTGGQLGGWSNS